MSNHSPLHSDLIRPQTVFFLHDKKIKSYFVNKNIFISLDALDNKRVSYIVDDAVIPSRKYSSTHVLHIGWYIKHLNIL
jgi:hypothetical protein